MAAGSGEDAGGKHKGGDRHLWGKDCEMGLVLLVLQTRINSFVLRAEVCVHVMSLITFLSLHLVDLSSQMLRET